MVIFFSSVCSKLKKTNFRLAGSTDESVLEPIQTEANWERV